MEEEPNNNLKSAPLRKRKSRKNDSTAMLLELMNAESLAK